MRCRWSGICDSRSPGSQRVAPTNKEPTWVHYQRVPVHYHRVPRSAPSLPLLLIAGGICLSAPRTPPAKSRLERSSDSDSRTPRRKEAFSVQIMHQDCRLSTASAQYQHAVPAQHTHTAPAQYQHPVSVSVCWDQRSRSIPPARSTAASNTKHCPLSTLCTRDTGFRI